MVDTDSDFEDFYIRYMAEGMPAGELMQDYCARHNVPYEQFDRWYMESRPKNEPEQDIYEPLGLTSEEVSRMLIQRQRMIDEAKRQIEAAEARKAELEAKTAELLATQQRLQSDMYNMQLAKFLLERHLAEKERLTDELRKRLASLDKKLGRPSPSKGSRKSGKSGRKRVDCPIPSHCKHGLERIPANRIL